MKFPIVCGDVEREVKVLRVLGGTPEVVVVEADGERRACDRSTGAPMPAPASFTALVAPGEIEVGGVRLAVTKTAVMRNGIAAEPRIEGDQAVTLPGLGALRMSPNGGNHRLVPTLIPARGRLVTVQNLVEWTTNDKPNANFERDTEIPWTLICEPTARVAIIATPRRASWITFETLETLTSLPAPAGFRSTTIECVVARAPAFPKLDYFYLDRSVHQRDAPGDIVADAFTPAMKKRIADVAAALELDLDLKTAATLAVRFGDALSKLKPAIVVGSLVEDHVKAGDHPEWIHGANTAARAARANAKLVARKDRARYVSFETLSYGEPTFARMLPAQKKSLAKLLELDPELPPLPSAENAKQLATAIAKLGEVAAPVVEWKRDRVVIRLDFETATKLEGFVGYPRSS